MYSVVLLMALSGSADAPSFGFHKNKGCNGCGGCVGCVGCDGGCAGCNGCGGCDGCGGGKGFLGGHKMFKRNGCGGCDGGCVGCNGGCVGCDGGCNGGKGFLGGHKWFKKNGCNGCDGGCVGCNGGCVGCDGGCIGGTSGHHGSIVMPKADAVATTAAPATIVVTLPAEAKLSIDGNSTTSSSERRVFVSPTLEAGQEYYYTLKAEMNGQVKEERVTVKAGQEVTVKIEIPAASVAAK